VNVPEDWFEAEQLHFAAQSGDVALLERLILGGSDPNVFDMIGNTPLHYAAEGEHFEAVRLLLSRGANVNARDERRAGDPPIAHVAQTCSLEMARLLLDAGADPTLPGSMQIDAIYRAKQRKRGDGPRVYELMCLHVGRNPKQ
jgi:ankyrin repeat protein